MALQLSYFAWVRERMGTGDEMVSPPAVVQTISDLVAWLSARDERGGVAFAEPARIRAAIDGAMAGPDAPISGAREIALFPPVTGG